MQETRVQFLGQKDSLETETILFILPFMFFLAFSHCLGFFLKNFLFYIGA